jgi:hypothetical protein
MISAVNIVVGPVGSGLLALIRQLLLQCHCTNCSRPLVLNTRTVIQSQVIVQLPPPDMTVGKRVSSGNVWHSIPLLSSPLSSKSGGQPGYVLVVKASLVSLQYICSM